VDPLERRAELLADERFREYKLKEQEERKKKEERKKAALMARGADGGQGDGLKRIDWVLVIINEMPELVESGLSDSEEIEAGDELGEEEIGEGLLDEQGLMDDEGLDENEDDLGSQGSDSESEITMEQVEGKAERRGEVDEGISGEENGEDNGSSDEEVLYGDGD